MLGNKITPEVISSGVIVYKLSGTCPLAGAGVSLLSPL